MSFKILVKAKQFFPYLYLPKIETMKQKTIIIIAAIFGGISVIMGAMGAHALKAVLEPQALQSYLTGTRYNMYHAIALLAIAGNIQYLNQKWLKLSVNLIMIGTILFSGSIYLLSTASISGIEMGKILGPVTPIGGLLLILGWFSVIMAAFKQQ